MNDLWSSGGGLGVCVTAEITLFIDHLRLCTDHTFDSDRKEHQKSKKSKIKSDIELYTFLVFILFQRI